MNSKIFFMFFLYCTTLFCQNKVDEYYQNLKKIKKIKENSDKTLPIIFNQLCQGGYFAMPSARMANSGNVAFGYSSSDPYKIIGVNLQYLQRLEISANFWIYKNILEGNFGKLGYGEDADRAANIKISILNQLDDFKIFPEISIGINDFYGSKRFNSKYIVLTKQYLNQNLELSLGFGRGRINGFFGGGAYFLFLKKNKFVDTLSFFAEYDANNYKKNICEHPKGKKVVFPVNVGLNLNFLKIFQATISSIRGDKFAGGINASYNLGQSKGLFPKFSDPIIYKDYSYLKEDANFSNNLIKAFKDQGFDLVKISFFYDKNNEKNLFLKIVNLKYRNAEVSRLRIENILTYVSLEDYTNILVTIESDGLDLHQYFFKKNYLHNFSDKKIGLFELKALCPIQDVSFISNETNSKVLYERKKQLWVMTFQPKINAFFGSCKGKFKYDGGFLLCQEGFFFNQVYYNLQASYIIKSGSAQVGSRDVYNPSKIINVRSDFVKYYESNSFHFDTCYLQKNWNLKKALFLKIAFGYFEVAYAGSAFEFLYYPINSNIACSLEAANVFKRRYGGLGFQKKIRKWDNVIEKYENFIGLQYFVNLFYEIKPLDLTLKTTFGQFLAKDKGIKIEFMRYFKSGFEVSCWITFTNKHDYVNSKRYYDKGFEISIPLDLFMNKTSRKRFFLKMSEWQRDIGAKAKTGKQLYSIIHDERYFR
jgi:hypothetical protein